MNPRRVIERIEAGAALPPGEGERFNGYGVMGLPFRSGHILALRRFPVSSIGPGYLSVWHRSPDGRWIFYSTVSPHVACPRFFGAELSDAIETRIDIDWMADDRARIRVPDASLDWEVRTGATPSTWLMSNAARLIPATVWKNGTFLAFMGMLANPILGAGRIGLNGTAPNGQEFIANPRRLWAVIDSSATLAGEDFGLPGRVHPQARLGDFWIPQRGILAIGQSYFETFDPDRHSLTTFVPGG